MNNSSSAFPTTNNIDLLRLFAALQVVIIHMSEHLLHASRSDNFALMMLSYIPGVPVFFFMSGLLIPRSYSRASSIREYIFNRVLRLYPALLVCIGLTVLMLISIGYMGFGDLFIPKVSAWLITQSTVLQFYNPDFFYNFGTGVINGSLWTISVEVQFYIMTPLLVILLRHKSLYFALFVLSVIANIAFQQFDLRELLLGKFLRVSFLPWIFMFMTGQLVYVYWSNISRFFTGKSLFWIALAAFQTILLILVEKKTNYSFSGNSILPITFFVLAGLVLALALNRPRTAKKVLKGNDISYGIYIYHMPIINLFIYLAIPVTIFSAIGAIGIVFAIAYLSWILIERPALRLKKTSILPR